MIDFPEIDFILPGEETCAIAYGAVSNDEWGQYALLKGVLPSDVSASPYEQTLSAFQNVDAELKKCGMDFSDVVRTWIYADRILDWYGDFNKARNAFFIKYASHAEAVRGNHGHVDSSTDDIY